MALFGIFGRKQEPTISWPLVAGQVTELLVATANAEPKRLTNPCARVVLRKDGTVFLASDKRNPRQILGWGDLTFVLLHEESSSFGAWVADLEADESPPFQLIATEEFAKRLTRTLMQNLDTSP